MLPTPKIVPSDDINNVHPSATPVHRMAMAVLALCNSRVALLQTNEAYIF